MTVIGIVFKKRNVDDSGFPRTPDRPVELLGTHVRYPRSVKTTIGACGPNSLGGSATYTIYPNFLCATPTLPISFQNTGGPRHLRQNCKISPKQMLLCGL